MAYHGHKSDRAFWIKMKHIITTQTNLRIIIIHP